MTLEHEKKDLKDTLAKINWSETLVRHAQNGDLKLIKDLFSAQIICDLVNVHHEEDRALKMAATNGHLEVVKYLLTSPDLKEHSDLSSQKYYAVRTSAAEGHLELLQYFLNEPIYQVNPHMEDDYFLRHAIKNNRMPIIKYLLANYFTTQQAEDLLDKNPNNNPKLSKYLKKMLNIKKEAEGLSVQSNNNSISKVKIL